MTTGVMQQISKRAAHSLARRLSLSKPLVFLDLEATGSSPDHDRVIEVATITLSPSGEVSSFHSLIDPERPIPRLATRIHRIGDDDVRNAPAFEAIAAELFGILEHRDLAGFNLLRFDLRLLAKEFELTGRAFTYDDVCIVDAMQIFHKKEPRDLSAAVRFYLQREHEGHRATSDVEATLELLESQLTRYHDLPRSVHDLDHYCRNRRSNWITSRGHLIWEDGAARLTFGRHAGQSLSEIIATDAQYLHWLVEDDNDFPDDLRRVIESALRGQLPHRPISHDGD